MLSLYIQYSVQNGEWRGYATKEKYGGPILGTDKFVRNNLSLRAIQLEKLASGAAVAKGKTKGKGHETVEVCVQLTTTGQRSRGDKCGMKHDPPKSENPRDEVRVRDRPALHEGTLWKDGLRQKTPSAKGTLPTCVASKKVIVQKGMLVITGTHLSVSFIKRKLQTWE